MTQAAAALASPHRGRRWGFWITILILVGLGALLAWRGYDYYRQPLDTRAVHPDYRTLNPAGFLGHGYGILGTALITTNLLYLVRRRFARHFPDWMGSVKAWLNAHAFTGLVGSLFVAFHSAFQLRTPIATVTSVSLGIVVVTGLVGLYLYELVPKAGLKPLKTRLAELEPLLPGMTKRIEEFVHAAPVTQLPPDASFLRTMFTVPVWILQARRRRSGVALAAHQDKLVRVLERTDPRLARDFFVELGDLAAADVDTHAGAAVMRTWRAFHRFLAILMLVTVTVHIGVAWYYGFRWIFE